jgi:hypothetical protein
MDSRITAAILLFGGGLSFAIGAGGPFTRGWNDIWYAPLERYLELIAEHRRTWFWANIFMIAAVVMNAAGLVLLAQLTGDPLVLAGAVAYAVGSVFWLMVCSFRSTTSVWAGEQLASTGRIPEAFAGIDLWVGYLFGLYTTISVASIAVIGVGLWLDGAESHWIAAVAIVFGAVGMVSRLPGASRIPGLRSIYEIPGLLHFPSAFIAAGLLIR